MQNLTKSPQCVNSLAMAFAATDYLVRAEPEPITIRVGVASRALDRVLDGRCWAIITAHNPDGVRRSDRRNAEAHKRLERDLHAIAPAIVLPARNRDPAGQWPDEPGWLFTPESFAQADGLARRFGQRALVTGKPGQPAELRMYGDWQGPVPEFTHLVGP